MEATQSQGTLARGLLSSSLVAVLCVVTPIAQAFTDMFDEVQQKNWAR